MKRFFKKWISFRKGRAEGNTKKYELLIGNHEYEHRFRGLEITFYTGWHHFDMKYETAGYFDSRPHLSLSLGYGWFYIALPFDSKIDECDPPRYGIYYYENGFWICYGEKIKCFRMPWDYTWVRTSALLKDQTYEHETAKDRKDFYKDCWKEKLWTGHYPYYYTLKSGKVQERMATVRVEEMEWRMRFLTWTKKFNKVRKSIRVEFSDEVGERTGSWKGGTTGCGYTLLAKESPLACLRRMEKERTFN